VNQFTRDTKFSSSVASASPISQTFGYCMTRKVPVRRHREARLLIQINSPQNQRDIRALISNSRRWRMYRLSLIVTAVGLLLAGSASATPRAEFRRAPQ
jgi:hypothetical protein